MFNSISNNSTTGRALKIMHKRLSVTTLESAFRTLLRSCSASWQHHTCFEAPRAGRASCMPTYAAERTNLHGRGSLVSFLSFSFASCARAHARRVYGTHARMHAVATSWNVASSQSH